MASALSIGVAASAAPSPLSDEDFLLFLAETTEEGDDSLDPLNMTTENTAYKEQPEQKDPEQKDKQQEDENED